MFKGAKVAANNNEEIRYQKPPSVPDLSKSVENVSIGMQNLSQLKHGPSIKSLELKDSLTVDEKLRNRTTSSSLISTKV